MFDFGIFDDLGFDQEQADSTPVVIPHRIKSIAAALTLPRIRLSLSASNPVPIVEIRISGEAFPYLIPRIITDRPPVRGMPVWVPVSATTFADFVNGRYWDGTAIVTDPSDMFQSDDADADPWNPLLIVPGTGYSAPSGEAGASYKGTALVSVGVGFVMVAEIEFTVLNGNLFAGNVYDGTFDNTFWSGALYGSAPGTGGNHITDLSNVHNAADLTTPTILGVNRVAFRFSQAKLSISVNGAATVSVNNPDYSTPVSVVTFFATADRIIHSVTTYPNTLNDEQMQVLTRIIPENAKIHINLVQNWAWTEADGFVAINTLLGSDPNTVNGWGVTSYDAGNLTADGYTSRPAFNGIALIRLLDIFTFSVRFKQVSGGGHNPSPLVLLSADGNDGLEVYTNSLVPDVRFDSYGGSHASMITAIKNSGLNAINVCAITVSGSRFELAVNGSAVSENTIASDDRPIGNPLVAALLDPGGHDAIQSITIYDALPSTAGLSALSETGVNTAPHDLVLTWYDNGAFGSNGSYVQGSFTAASPQTFASFGSLSAADSEGNPITFSVTADETAKLYIENSTALAAQSDFTSTGNFNFTLRATDPGGLYVEQQFTITVTSGVPEWVPADAKIYIDLVNDRAWTEADGEVAINTLLGADANTANGWGTTAYDAGNLTVDGYAPAAEDSNVAFIGSARTFLLAGATIVTRAKDIGLSVAGSSPVVYVSADGNHAIEFDRGAGFYIISSYDGPLGVGSSNRANVGTGAINVAACTYTGTRADMASNGADVITSEVTSPEVVGLVAVLFQFFNCALQSITIYDALPDTTGLSALSETGVTNTAPHDLIWSDFDGNPTTNTAFMVSYPATLAQVNNINVTDDEGNPCTLSLPSDETGLLWFHSDSGYGTTALANGSNQVLPQDSIPVGTYTFTLRATDPGDLYVEQQFTITVTPNWLPAGAVLFIDTVNDHYYADGAVRTKDDVLIDNSPIQYGFTATALTAWGGSAWTTVLQTNYSTDMEIGTGNNFSILGGVGGVWSFYDQNGPDSPSVASGGGASSRIAVSATSSSYSGSAVGGSVQSGTMGSPFAGNAAATLSHVNIATDQIVVVVYPTATADADLPALSTLS